MPCTVVGLLLGWQLLSVRLFDRHGPLLLGLPCAAALGLAYVFLVRRFLRDMQLGERITKVLRIVRLV